MHTSHVKFPLVLGFWRVLGQIQLLFFGRKSSANSRPGNHRRQAMHTLFRSIANGLSWDVVVRPLIQVGWLWGPWAQPAAQPAREDGELGFNGSWF